MTFCLRIGTGLAQVEKFRSSERSFKMPEKLGMPYKCKFANQGKTTASTWCNCNGLLWVFVCLFFCTSIPLTSFGKVNSKHTLNLFWQS